MITITRGVTEFLNSELRGMKEYVVVDQKDYEEITKQEGWEAVCWLEAVEGGRLWQLWHAKEWAESKEKLSQAKAASQCRVLEHNATLERLAVARQRLTQSGKFTPAQVNSYLSNIDQYPKLKQALGL